MKQYTKHEKLKERTRFVSRNMNAKTLGTIGSFG
jgi:hypothetical protein